MRNLVPLVTLVFVAMTLVASFYLFRSLSIIGAAQGSEIIRMELLTGKDVYRSGEDILIKAIVYSSKPLSNVSITLNGIEGKMRLEEVVTLDMGVNEFDFSYRLPQCNACGGISPGRYNITGQIVHGNTTASTIREIEIIQ